MLHRNVPSYHDSGSRLDEAQTNGSASSKQASRSTPNGGDSKVWLRKPYSRSNIFNGTRAPLYQRPTISTFDLKSTICLPHDNTHSSIMSLTTRPQTNYSPTLCVIDQNQVNIEWAGQIFWWQQTRIAKGRIGRTTKVYWEDNCK